MLGGIILTVTALSGPAALAQDGNSAKEEPLGLSAEEQRWLSDNPVIRVHNELDWPPFNFNEDGVSQGLSIDVMNLLAKKAGLQVEYVSGPSWSEFLEMMKSGDLDVMLNIVKTPDRQTYMLYTRPYVDNPNTILSRRDTPYDSLEQLFGKTISVPKGFFYEEILKRDFPRIKLHLVKDTLDAMKAVTFGEADAALGELAVFNYLKTRHLITDLVLSGEVSMGDPEYALLNIATRKDLPLLASILDKALKTVTSEQQANIRDRWVGDRAPGVDVTWVIRIGGVVLVLLLGIALWNWRLRREIHNRRRIEDAQRTILEAISLPIIVVEQSSNTLKYVNEAAAGDRDRGSMIGMRAEDIYWNPSDRAMFLDMLKKQGKVDRFEVQLKSPDGQPLWVLLSSRIVTFEGEPAYLSTWTDIAENKRVEEALRESEHRLLSILEESPTGTSITRRTDGRFLWGNRRVAEMFGVDQDELLELSARDFYVDPRQREEMLARFERDGSVRDMELPWKRMSDGETVWILLSAVPFEFEGEQALLGWHYDVTERKEAEQAQRDLLEMIPFRLAVSDAETSELLYVNEYARNAYGLETGGGRITTAYKDPEQREELVRRLRRDGRVDDFEAELYSSDGTPEWLLVSARLMDFEGQRAVLAVSQVITDRKRAETDLTEKEAQLRVALENMPGGICYTDKDRNYIFFNSQYSELYGFPEGLLKVGDHVRVENLYQAKRGDFGDGDPEVLTDEWMSHRPYELEPTNYERHIGADRILDCRMQPTALGGIVTIVTDMTERKRAEEDLKRASDAVSAAQSRMMDAIESVSEGFALFDDVDRLVLSNSKYQELYGYSDADAVPGTPLADLIHLDVERGTIAKESDGEETLHRRTESYGETDETFDVPLADGRWVQIRDRRTSEGGTVSIHADVTERKRAEEAAEAATRAKSDFIAVVSHEVRTPMNGVLGMARLLLESSLPLEQHDFARTIVESGEALLSILNDLLDTSKLEAGKMDLETTPFSARPLFEDTVAVMSSRAREKGLHLNCAIDTGVPVALVGDANRLRQILLNLLSNAVKFTDQGDISVDVTGQLDDRGRFVLEMAVSDTGIGISADAVGKLFSPYVQESAGVARKYGGTGLGLSISRNLADLMGGTIALVSEVGQGSTFTLTVPFEIADAAAKGLLTFTDRGAAAVARPSPAESGIGLNLLVVEDNLVNRKVAVGMLGKLGHAATVAENGREALEVMDRAGPFDVVLMDRHMPVMDGLETTRRIRAMDGPLSAIPIIGVTAAVTEREIEACLEIGMNDVVTKPIDPDALAAALVRVTPAVTAAGTADHPIVAQAAVSNNAQAVDAPVLSPKVLDRLREDFGDDGLAELVDDFGQISPASVAGTLRAVEVDDAEHMIRFSHDLKGSAASLGLMRLSALCRRIEVAGMDDRTSEAREMGQGLQSTLDEALPALASYVQREEDARSEPDDARRKFLDKMTHDLRNQINGVMGWVMLLEEVGENHTPEELEDYVSQIREEGVLMQALAANIQTLFRIESGQYDVAPEPLDPARLAHLAIDDAGHEAQPRGISLDLEIEDDLPVISVDDAATRQMLGNLITNALQVTPDGGEVKLRVNRDPTGLVIIVSDQGPALTAADLAAMRRPYGGIAEIEGDQGLIGFRFNVVDQLAGLVGGRLEIESGEKGGTRATLSLPGIVPSDEAVGNA